MVLLREMVDTNKGGGGSAYANTMTHKRLFSSISTDWVEVGCHGNKMLLLPCHSKSLRYLHANRDRRVIAPQLSCSE